MGIIMQQGGNGGSGGGNGRSGGAAGVAVTEWRECRVARVAEVAEGGSGGPGGHGGAGMGIRPVDYRSYTGCKNSGEISFAKRQLFLLLSSSKRSSL